MHYNGSNYMIMQPWATWVVVLYFKYIYLTTEFCTNKSQAVIIFEYFFPNACKRINMSVKTHLFS